MSLHTTTLSALQSAVKHALGKDPADSGYTDAATIVNDAMQFLASYHKWSWRMQSVNLNFVSGQNSVNLPADFSMLNSLRRASTWGDAVPATLDEINFWRQQSQTPTFTQVYYCVNWTPQASVTSTPQAKLDIFPTPSASASGALVCSYLRVIPKLEDTTDVPDMPPAWHLMLKKLCRAFALSDEEQQEGVDWDYFNNNIAKLIEEDGGNQPSLGRMEGDVPRHGFYRDPFLAPVVTY